MTTTEINFDARFKVSGYRGIAFYLVGYAKINEPTYYLGTNDDGEDVEIETGEFEQVDDTNNVIAVMVGDDRKHTVSVDDLTEIADEDYCHECGQIGCTHDGRN